MLTRSPFRRRFQSKMPSYHPRPHRHCLRRTNNCIKILVNSPNVTGAGDDVKVIGLQIVSHTNSAISSVALRGAPGNNANYLLWREPAGAVNFAIFRATGTTNTWTNLITTAQLSFDDTNVVAGLSYFYKVIGTNQDGTAEPQSGVVGPLVPFGCAPPLPPRLDYVNILQAPVNNGVYAFTYQTLMTNSDAFDPQNYPLNFIIDRVLSGSLLINGSPFGPTNNLIGPSRFNRLDTAGGGGRGGHFLFPDSRLGRRQSIDPGSQRDYQAGAGEASIWLGK